MALLSLTIVPLIFSDLATADVPLLINYRGYVDVTDPVIGLPTGVLTVDLEFNLYDTSETEGATPLWTETQTSQLLDGNFAVLLGSVNSLNLNLFSAAQRYLTVSVEGNLVIGAQQILSVPYAMQAGNVYSASDGRVGIGTPSPSAKLDVQGTIKTSSNFQAEGNVIAGGGVTAGSVTSGGLIQSNSGGFKFPDATTQTTQAIGDGHSLDAADGSPKDAISVDTDGNVGIGTPSPEAALHLSSTESVQVLLEADTDDDLIGDANDHPQIRFSQDGGMVTATVGFLDGQDNVFGLMSEYYSINADLILGTSDTERMRITADGRIGMGTNSPEARLHVAGDGIIEGTLQLDSATETFYAPGALGNFKIICGNVSASGIVNQGEGFTASRTGTGLYQIIFSVPFSTVPFVVISAGDPTAHDDNVADVNFITNEQFHVATWDAANLSNKAENSWFSFIAIGPK